MLSFIENTHQKRFRCVLWLVLILSVLGVLGSLFSQYVLGMNPCVMCIQQRMALGGVLVCSLLALLLPERFWARSVSLILVGAPAVFGLFIAIQQIHLQTLPLSAQPSCGAPWTFRWRNAPLFDYYEWFIRGSGACGEVYRVLGVSLPIWSAAFFLFILLLILGAYLQSWRAE